MLIAQKMQDFDFSALMEVYTEGNIENGRERYPDRSDMEQIRLAEDDFYYYLTEDFFRHMGATYFILEEDGRYVSALRTEPYRDGLLLQALETHPQMRRRGFAKRLILETVSHVGKSCYTKIYSHVSKRNTVSLALHKNCGFEEISDHATYLDGTVTQNAVTMCIILNTRR